MPGPRTPTFTGRARERAELDGLLRRVRRGEGSVLVIRGEAGIGKTALLHDCARQAPGFRIMRISGVESEMELPFAAIHQLCTPMLDRLGELPTPQQRALRVAFGLAGGRPADPFLVGLATLGLMSEIAAEQPLACLVDDAQWLDGASKQVLGFVGRRLIAEPVLLLFALRDESEDQWLSALPSLPLGGLTDEDARELLAASVPGRLEERVRDRLIAETRGNPLALLELVGGMSREELAGGFGGPSSVSSRMYDTYLQRIRGLPEATRLLLLTAAADSTADAALVWRAGRALGLGRAQAVPAESEQLLVIDSLVRFRHPLVRSAAYAAADAEQRRMVHRALAEATDPAADPDRRLWHLAAATTAPDEDIAAELQRAAGRAGARGGLSAAAGFLQRSVALTHEPETRVERALAATRAHLQAGSLQAAGGLLAEAEADARTNLQRAHVAQLRGQIDWASSPGPAGPVQLLSAAARLDELDMGLARQTYLDAWIAALVADRLAEPGGHLPEVSRAAARAKATLVPSDEPADLLLHGLVTMIDAGVAAGTPSLRRAVDAFLDDPDADWFQRGGALVPAAAAYLWDFDSWAILAARLTERARRSGALAPLVTALSVQGMVAAWRGDLGPAAALLAEGDVVAEAIGGRMFPGGSMLLAGYRGRPAEAMPLIEATAAHAADRGEGLSAHAAHWAEAILRNGLGQYAEAMTAAEQALGETYVPQRKWWVLPELVEAAVRTGKAREAEDALRRLSEHASDSDWVSGIEARCRALLTEGPESERFYAEAVERLGRTALRPEHARAHLLYGEWLRREQRRTDARQRLRTAHDLFTDIGAEAFAERARRELAATGQRIRKPTLRPVTGLTPQEAHIARLARDGRTNPEIGAELFISARTVEWHLSKIFTKLGISSRKALRDALPAHTGQG
ncbi:helix-turn-helix transcriptional regulator [Actinomadura decatromicini]|uniref:AAA family ATPase n=1 Tax=Actinomadura decatromicini TaxID=2604572 RepID=A0A5D3F7U0_9ACTN|nr:LuxR family transcriptional regulator [Actinomadura decatromicini]TYK44129.1 AAA family ATPase [Actinomadura decatromicini]